MNVLFNDAFKLQAMATIYKCDRLILTDGFFIYILIIGEFCFIIFFFIIDAAYLNKYISSLTVGKNNAVNS